VGNAANEIKLWKGAVQPGTVLTDQIVTNVWVNANDLSDAGIQKLDSTAIPNYATAPDEADTACALQATLQAGAQTVVAQDTVSLPYGGPWCMSAYVKKDSIQYCILESNLWDSALGLAAFDMDDSAALVSLDPDLLDADSEAASLTYPDSPAGWYRIWIVFETYTDLLGRPKLGISELSGIVRVTDPTTDDRNLFWGVQLEPGLSPGPVTFTTGAAATERHRTFGASSGNVIQLWKGAVEPTADSTPVGIPGQYINGTRVTDGGAILTVQVSNTYSPLASDVLINGTLHNSVGYMYVTYDVPTNEFFINGISHAANGVRFVEISGGANKWPEGFATADDGTMLINTAAGTYLLRGIARESDGSLMIQA